MQWAAQQRRAGHPVFVHCAHGHGRSTVVLCAALVGYCACLQTAEQIVQALAGADLVLGLNVHACLAEFYSPPAQRLCWLTQVEFGIAKTFEEAFQMIKGKRPRVKLNVRQRKALEDWALARTRKL